MRERESDMIRWWLTSSYVMGKEESNDGNYALGGLLILCQLLYWFAFVALSPFWIPLWILGYAVSRFK